MSDDEINNTRITTSQKICLVTHLNPFVISINIKEENMSKYNLLNYIYNVY